VIGAERRPVISGFNPKNEAIPTRTSPWKRRLDRRICTQLLLQLLKRPVVSRAGVCGFQSDQFCDFAHRQTLKMTERDDLAIDLLHAFQRGPNLLQIFTSARRFAGSRQAGRKKFRNHVG
jgi:hypothetical protein